MLKKFFKQKTMPWIGEFKETLSQALWWGTIVNFVMLAATFYYTTLRYIWPWFDLPKFVAAIMIGAVVIYIIEYKWIVPSIWAFRGKQMFDKESQLMSRLDAIDKKLDTVLSNGKEEKETEEVGKYYAERYVQVCNPVTKKFVKIDRRIGAIVAHKKTSGPYKNIPIKGERYDLLKDTKDARDEP